MSNIKLITVCSHPEHAQTLVRSATANGWDIAIVDCGEWRGFGAKLIETQNYLLKNTHIHDFIFVDAFDVVMLGTPEEAREKLHHFGDKIVCGTEKGLWPPPLHAFRSKYKESGRGFDYINSGVYYSSRDNFLSLMEKFPPNFDHDDQLWLNLCYLLEPERFALDYYQSVFNNHSFPPYSDYGYQNNRLQIFGYEPILAHFNGKSVDETFNERVKI